MKIKDIVNKEVTQITNCEHEPIHIPGSIQPHGFLLGIDETSFQVKYCSANIDQLLGTASNVLAKNIGHLWSELLDSLQRRIAEVQQSKHPMLISKDGKHYDVSVYRTNSTLVLEIELHQNISSTNLDLFDHTSRFVSHISRSVSLQQLCQSIADEIRTITGYDRVMIYRFDKQFNGEVYAESCTDGMAPFLGLHYPHTDIPPQARDLYLRTLSRMIADVQYEPVPLLTVDDGTNPSLDLSDAFLRSVSPIHIQYLRNMNVGATLTISLLQDEKLWGLIACHHKTPKALSYEARQTVLMQGHFLSSQIRVRNVAEEFQLNVIVEAHLQQLLNKIDVEEEFSQKFNQFTSLLGVTNANGVVVLHEGELFEKGLVPSKEEILNLIRWIDANIKSMTFNTSSLIRRYPQAEQISRNASGIIYHSLGKATENCVIWFRQEKEQTVNWAGNPNEAIQKNAQGYPLTPRKSFEMWKEKVKFQSAEWRVPELNAASRFASALQNHFHLLHLQQEDVRLRILNEQLLKANEELSNINWITSHDLKEPLRKIQLFASRIVEDEKENISETIKTSIERIQRSASRMHHLVDDIMSYTMVSHKESKFQITDLNSIVRDVTEELQEELTSKDVALTVESLPENVRVIPHQMRQLFTNLISNAVKFMRQDIPGQIYIACERVMGRNTSEITLKAEKEFFKISIRDNGIGFDSAQSRKIFDLFYRLHSKETYAGTGIGLAICKRIMENNHGVISASSEEGRGAVFTLYLPA